MKRLTFTFLLLSYCLTACAQPTFQTRVVKDSLFIPWEIIWGPDGHIWFTQKNGFICRLDPATSHTDTLWHQTNTAIQSEGGMLGLALHPQLLNGQPYVYVAYEYESGGLYLERIQRLTYNSADNTLGSPVVLLDSIRGANFHNGCRLLIADDYLFITTGDATVQSLSQNLSSINGKVLRMHLDGTVPVENPIPGSFIYSWGHRNAQGLVFDSGKLYSSEHGNSTDDEINIIQKGRNYGWPNVEGFCDQPAEMSFCADSNVVEPLITWTPTIAPSGIDYYNHPMFPGWQKSILMTTLKDSRLYRLKLNSAQDGIDSAVVIAGVNFGRLRDVCISPEGRVFISTSNSDASGVGPFKDRIIELYDPSYTGVTGLNPDAFTLAPNPAQDLLRVLFQAPLSGPTKYQVTDSQGRAVLRGKWQTGEKEAAVPVKNLSAGNYWLEMQTDGRQYPVLPFQKK